MMTEINKISISNDIDKDFNNFLSIIVDKFGRLTSDSIQDLKEIHKSLYINRMIANDLFFNSDRLDQRPRAIQGIANNIDIPNQDTYYEKMVDLISLFYIHKLIQSELLGKFQYNQGRKLIQRFKRHDWYKKEENLIKFMDDLSILIEYLN